MKIIKIEKIKCDGCGKEYDIGDPKITLRVLSAIDSRTKIKIENIDVGISKDSSLDFCDITCFQAYITKMTEVIEDPTL